MNRYKVIPYLQRSQEFCLTAAQISDRTGVDLRRVKNSLKTAVWRGSVILTNHNDQKFYTARKALHDIHKN